ncbi:helix-turn-helix domain-containing protein [Streptosporangium canum]|nr:winged helix-turn-helix domain-containing protein [Streptosporangium canum]
MRYSDRGGLSMRARAERERLRFVAADMFAGGMSAPQVARELSVTRKSACAWRRAWEVGGKAALASKGPGGNVCRLSADQLDRLVWELERGPAAYGWSDQRWTLPRIAAVIKRLFRVSYTARGVAYLLRGQGWSPQVPVHRAAERNEEQITAWKGWRWSALKGPRRPGAPGSSSTTNRARAWALARLS